MSETPPPPPSAPTTLGGGAPQGAAPEAADAEAASYDDLPEQLRVRLDKRARLLASGVEPYPVGFPRTASLTEVRGTYTGLEPDTATGVTVAVTGRVMLNRVTGKLCFATIREDGEDLQVMLSLDRVGTDRLAAWKTDVDLGDHVGVTGEVITSRRGELSVLATDWRLTAKALRPLPNAHKPMSEETRVRRRYVDLIVRPEARRMVELRAGVVRSLRASFQTRGFLEVETPMLQVVHGGATARPFITHINAYDLDLFLRIAPELYLKRCVVGGLHKVFEINRNFRNEGADSTHSPEFAMLEAYAAYGDYDTMAVLARELVQEAALAVFGQLQVTYPDGTELELGGDWPAVTLHGAVSAALGTEITPDTSLAELRVLAESREVPVKPAWGAGKLTEEIFEFLVQPTLIAPTFVRDYPVETAPLTRAHRSTPGLTEKWDLYVMGTELGTAYSELIDPVVQRDRLVAQAQLAAGGDDEAMGWDEDFLRALEHAMPPSGGLGMGVDRLLSVFTGKGIRETMLFPMVRPTNS